MSNPSSYSVSPLSASLHGLGTALPRGVRTSAEIEATLGLASGWISRHTGIVVRPVAAPDETPVSLGTAALRGACARAGCTPDALDAVIWASATRQQAIPCTAAFVARTLALHGRACYDMDATCLSFLAGLNHAALLVAHGGMHRVAVVSAEVPSLGVDWTQPSSAVLMGDAAAAAIVGQAQGHGRIFPLRLRTFPDGAELAELPGLGARHPPAHPLTRPEHARFRMDGPKLFRFAARQAGAVIAEHMAEIGWQTNSVQALVPHQASAHALRSVAKICGFAGSQILENIAERGNCLAASIPLLLAEAAADGRIRHGDRVLLAGTAAGVTVGAMALIR